MLMKRTRSLILFLFVATTLTAAQAQKNEFTVMASTFQTSASYNAHGGQGLELNYARRIVNIEVASLYLELPFAAAWGGNRSITQGNLLHENYNTTCFTPGLKLKLLPGSVISPYLAGGLGWGGFRSSHTARRRISLQEILAAALTSTFCRSWACALKFAITTPVRQLWMCNRYFTEP
jgi:predicted permease